MSVGMLVKWYKTEGNLVIKGEPLFSIETDKTSIDIEATQDGVFRKKFIEEGDTINVTLPIAIVADANENIDALIQDINCQLNIDNNVEFPQLQISSDNAEAGVATSATETMESFTATPGGEMFKITPRGRRTAKEKGISLQGLSITGTGYQGGISEKDILAYLESSKVKVSPVAQKMADEQGINLEDLQGTGIHGKIMKRDLEPSTSVLTPTAQEVAANVQFTSDGKEILEEIPYAGVRKIIGERMAQSKFTAPHLYFVQKVNLERLLDIRIQVNAAQDKKTSVTDFIAKAVIKTLQKYPEMNGSLIGDKIVKYKSINLGIAVATPKGLIVPVIKNAQAKSVVEISKDASLLFDKARSGKLTPDEYTVGTFTISNLGMFGIENFTAIINSPELGILAVSATKDEVVVVKDANGTKSIEIKPMMNITLTVDHRVIDGLLAAQFVTEIKRLLENPFELLV